MNPLSERKSKSWAKATVACLWSASALLAAPMLLFFEFTHVFDELNGGSKPFCALRPTLTHYSNNNNNSSSSEDVEEATTLSPHNSTDLEVDEILPEGALHKMTTFQVYNCLLAVVQVNTMRQKEF